MNKLLSLGAALLLVGALGACGGTEGPIEGTEATLGAGNPLVSHCNEGASIFSNQIEELVDVNVNNVEVNVGSVRTNGLDGLCARFGQAYCANTTDYAIITKTPGTVEQ